RRRRAPRRSLRRQPDWRGRAERAFGPWRPRRLNAPAGACRPDPRRCDRRRRRVRREARPRVDQAARTAFRKLSSSVDSCCDCCLSEPAAFISSLAVLPVCAAASLTLTTLEATSCVPAAVCRTLLLISRVPTDCSCTALAIVAAIALI